MTTQLTLNQLVEFVVAFVCEQHGKTGNRVNGAALAAAVRHRFPNLSYSDVGVERLSDVVRAAVDRGLLIRHRDVSHLEVSPPPTNPTQSPPDLTQPPQPSGLVRTEIWRAFLFFNPGTARYFDRDTASIIDISEASATDYRASSQYVRLNTIPPEIQKGWMREFLKDHPAAAGAGSTIESFNWYVSFPSWLRANQPELVKTWASFRARLVVEFTRQWANENNIPLSQVLEASRPRQASLGSKGTKLVKATSPEIPENLRDAIIRVVSELPLDDLLSLSVPLRHVVRHFKAR